MPISSKELYSFNSLDASMELAGTVAATATSDSGEYGGVADPDVELAEATGAEEDIVYL